MAQTTHLRSVSMGDGNAHCGNITGSFNTVYKSDEDAEIMRWLSPLEPNTRHQDVCADRFGGVGDWLLETREWREWREWRGGDGNADRAILFCSGNLGVGKTYLTSLVIDSLRHEAKEDIAVAGLYYDFLAQQEQTIANVMGAILRQLLGRGDIPKDIREAFQEGKGEIDGRGLRLADLMRMLRIAIASLRQVFICIDALDECRPKHLPELLKSLRDIVQESPTTRIFLTGRPHIREDIQRHFTTVVVIPISPNTDDIRSYLEMRLDGDADPEAMNDDLRGDIVRIILEKLSDIFLLASLNIDAILGEVTIRQRRKKLEEVKRGSGLGDAYTATLTRVKAQTRHRSILGLKALMWVSHSERPLRAQELSYALGVEMGSADLDQESIPALRTLLASCLGLVTVEASSSTIRLVHPTLQGHLSNDPMLFHSPHSTIAEVCLTYLNFGCVWDLSPILHSAPSRMPLLEYASCYWGKHARRGMTENAKILALRLLDRFDEHISAQLLLLHYNRTRGSGPYFCELGGPSRFTGLHGVAFLGIAEIAAAVLEMKEWEINAADCMGSTALAWAARRGQAGVAKVLLEREDIDPNQADTRDGRTPLSWAAEYGHVAVVKMLLERKDVCTTAPDNENQTPLSLALAKGHDAVVRILMERGGVDSNTGDRSGQASFPPPAGDGDKYAVEMRFRDGDPNTDIPNLGGQSVVKKPAAEKQAVGKSVPKGPKKHSTPNGEQISGWLKDVIINHRKGLQRMYGETEAELDESLKAPITRGEEMARKLVMMGCDIQVAKSLTLLTLYDVAALIDDSDSMISEENGARKETLIKFIDDITEIYSMANESGICAMRFMSRGGGKKNWNEKSSREYLDRHCYGGVSRIGTELKKILDEFATGNPNQSKPLLVLIITNSGVEGERKGHLKKVIRECVKEREGAGKGRDAVTFQFSCIGNNYAAAQLLTDLDQDRGIGEYIDILPVEFELESLLADKWFVLPKILLGAILPSWDTEDDYSRTEIRDYFTDDENFSGGANSGSDWEDWE